jgi:serine/threonine protein kinase/tetratricopeptide (TPR) repeat protein
MPGPLKYDHFEVEVGADGFPVELGAGAMAITYRARDTVLKSTVALKVIDRRAAQNPGARSRFLREARAAAQIHHPNVARVSHYGEQDGECFYVMELVHGETLEERVRREGPMPLALALEVIGQAARAVAAAEACGVVHRDIKPSNIMIESDPSDALVVKVIDYGVVKVLAPQTEIGAEQTQAGFVGTPAFASPEQFVSGASESHVDTRSDIYSLGVTLWYLLTGRVPFLGGSMEDIRSKQQKGPPIEELRARHVPLQVVSLLKSMLAPDPKDRPQSARELLSDLHRCCARFNPEARARRRRVILTRVSLTLAVGAIALIVWWQQHGRNADEVKRSIAVLPFENLSSSAEDAYFAVGIQDQILMKLASLADLKVISRTSTERYKSKPTDLKTIGQQLGVGRILEGSVQREGDRVRVIVQLIDARTDAHLWANTYDRPLDDSFAVETEVANVVAQQLSGGSGQKISAERPTQSAAAYNAYLRGLAYSLKAVNTPANALGAQKYLREAVRLDPKFALSWALLSYVDARGYITTALQPTPALREEAQHAAETALALQPNLSEALLAKGYYHYACLKDYDTAVRYFERAQRLLPNSSQIPESMAYLTRRQGQSDRSESYFNEAERLDPRNTNLLTQHALSYIDLRRFPDALRKLDQVLDIIPDDVDTVTLKAAIAQAEGDLPRASALLIPLHPAADDATVLETQTYQAILERRPAQIILRLKEILIKPNPELGYINGELRFWLGWAQEVSGDHAAAQETWRQAHGELDGFLKEQPDNWALVDDLALTNMGLRDKAAALALLDRTIAAVPIEKDAIDGPAHLEILARVCAQLAEPDRAIDSLQKILSIPYGSEFAANVPLTPALLRLDPMFDPLRNDPRFQKLVDSHASKSPDK